MKCSADVHARNPKKVGSTVSMGMSTQHDDVLIALSHLVPLIGTIGLKSPPSEVDNSTVSTAERKISPPRDSLMCYSAAGQSAFGDGPWRTFLTDSAAAGDEKALISAFATGAPC